MTKIELDDVLKIINDIPKCRLGGQTLLSIESVDKLKNELKQLANQSPRTETNLSNDDKQGSTKDSETTKTRLLSTKGNPVSNISMCKHCGEIKDLHEKIEVCNDKFEDWETLYVCLKRQKFEPKEGSVNN